MERTSSADGFESPRPDSGLDLVSSNLDDDDDGLGVEADGFSDDPGRPDQGHPGAYSGGDEGLEEPGDRPILISGEPKKWHQTHSRLIIAVVAFGLIVGASVVIGALTNRGPIVINPLPNSPLERAREMHNRQPMIDTHNDLISIFRRYSENSLDGVIDLTKDLVTPGESSIPPSMMTESHTDIPHLIQGGVGGVFWSVYTPCSSQDRDTVRIVLENIDMVKRMIQKYEHLFEYVTTSKGIEDAFANGRIASLLGSEGGHSIDSSLGALRAQYDLGVRYLTLTHSCQVPWADSHNGPYTNGGLTEFGERVVSEMNRLGMMIDLSHVSDDTMRDALRVSTAPVLFSHSSARALCDHTRNVPDDILELLVDNKGVVQVNFYNWYVSCSKSSTLNDVANHIDHIASICGRGCVGYGADYNGVDAVPDGLENVSKYPYLTAEMISRGWSDSEIYGLIGGNLLRVMKEVEKEAKRRSSIGETPDPGLNRFPGDCRTTY